MQDWQANIDKDVGAAHKTLIIWILFQNLRKKFKNRIFNSDISTFLDLAIEMQANYWALLHQES